MAEIEEQLKKALEELRKNKEKKFNQTVDLIINLQKYDVRKNPLNLFINVPHRIKEKKVAAYLPKYNLILAKDCSRASLGEEAGHYLHVSKTFDKVSFSNPLDSFSFMALFECFGYFCSKLVDSTRKCSKK